MPLPLIRSCLCLPLRIGCLIFCTLSTLACIANITAGAWKLPSHKDREPEDNLISLSMVMFSTLSAIANIVALFGIFLKRPGNLQLSLMSNSVFIVCIFLVAIVTCVFRLDDFFQQPAHIAFVVFMLIIAAAYSICYLMVIDSLYRTMKMTNIDSAVPI